MSMFLICGLICSYTPPIFDDNITADLFEGASTVSDTVNLGAVAETCNVIIRQIIDLHGHGAAIVKDVLICVGMVRIGRG